MPDIKVMGLFCSGAQPSWFNLKVLLGLIMTKTASEIYFENLCADLGIRLKRIQETNSKTPDYELTIDEQIVVAEVKEMTPNKEEQESDRVLQERGYGNVLSTTPGDRVRKKISESSPQIKARAMGKYPSLLVLFDRGFVVAGHLDPYCIRVAMYGLEQVHIAVPIDPSVSPYATGMSYGPKRKMTEEHNTSISAIGVLFATEPNTIVLHVYHNKFAAVPLEPRLLAKHGIRQFKIKDEVSGNTAKWEQVLQIAPQPGVPPDR